ncbi:MAG: HAMP domain-containing protein [Anaerolineae bacterium]|nr:HAMP domain-containing protein [Gemmatimonadaceae bacterium]
MRIGQRLLLGSLLVIAVLVILLVVVTGIRLQSQLTRLSVEHQTRDARLLAALWIAGTNSDSLADVTSGSLGTRVSLIDSSGRVVGDSRFDGEDLARHDNHADRPEVIDAWRSGFGWSRRLSASGGTEELYAAVRGQRGIARVSSPTLQLDIFVRRVQRDILVSGLVTLAAAAVLSWLFSRSISAPVEELRDVARALAAGDLTHRPVLTGPGEVGDLADAIHRMAEQLGGRLHALAAEDALLAGTIESLDEGILVIDSNRRVIRANDSARRLLGVRSEVPFSADLLPRDRALSETLADALAGRDTLPSIELDLTDRTLEVRVRALTEGRAVLAVLDLSAQRRLEMVRRDFVANVSHELKTPLTVIGGFAETLATDQLSSAQQAHFARAILASARRMQRLVEDLLDLSRIESGGWKPNPVELEALSVFEEVLTSYHAEATAKKIVLAVDVDPQAAKIFADPTALRQVLFNLVENALRHTPPEGTVTLYTAAEEGGIWIGVRDTGIGIAPEHLSRIFERFYRVDSGRARESGGTGLGLAIVRHLVEGHGGQVVAESAPSRGTTVMAFFRHRSAVSGS